MFNYFWFRRLFSLIKFHSGASFSRWISFLRLYSSTNFLIVCLYYYVSWNSMCSLVSSNSFKRRLSYSISNYAAFNQLHYSSRIWLLNGAYSRLQFIDCFLLFVWFILYSTGICLQLDFKFQLWIYTAFPRFCSFLFICSENSWEFIGIEPPGRKRRHPVMADSIYWELWFLAEWDWSLAGFSGLNSVSVFEMPLAFLRGEECWIGQLSVPALVFKSIYQDYFLVSVVLASLFFHGFQEVYKPRFHLF